jgi:hypothetical protein
MNIEGGSLPIYRRSQFNDALGRANLLHVFAAAVRGDGNWDYVFSAATTCEPARKDVLSAGRPFLFQRDKSLSSQYVNIEFDFVLGASHNVKE